MKTIYEVMGDVNVYQQIQFDDERMHDKYKFDGAPLKKRWKNPAAYIIDPTKAQGDFWPCCFGVGIFALGRPTAKKLGKCLEKIAEFLPLPVEEIGGEVLVCHPTAIVDCLDMEASEVDFETNWIDSFVIRSDQLGASLFRLPAPLNIGIYSWEDSDVDPELQFKSSVEKFGLKGLRFKECWSEK